MSLKGGARRIGVCAVTAMFALSGSAYAQDELPPDQDTGAENSCGTPCLPSDDPPPKQACADVRSQTGSLVERRLPRGPVLDDGTPAFRSGVCVYLPPGYESSDLRYPVLYLLHGGGGDQGDWISQGGVQEVFDGLYRADPRNALIVVTPDGTSDASWFDRLEGGPRNEQYVLHHLVGFMDGRYRTIADRRGRAIAGLSNGGHGAMYLAATAPDLFNAVGAMSANIGWASYSGGAELNKSDSPAWFNGHLPLHLASNLDGLDLIMDIGTSCTGDATQDGCGTFAFEQIFVADNRAFVAELNDVRHAGVHDYRETEGGHSWRWWPKWLGERELPFILERLDDPTTSITDPAGPRLPFRYRSVQTSFSVYGYDVRVDRDAREFLDLTDVRKEGLTVRGSGKVRITTAPLYVPGGRYLVNSELATADADGRLRLQVDLGPPHEHEQFTAGQQQAETRGGYWVTRRVLIEPVALPTGNCADTREPLAVVERVAIGRRGVTIRGRATDRGCAGVSTVLVSVARRAGKRCRFLSTSGRLGRRSSCTTRKWIRADGAADWVLRRTARLPRGRYRVWLQALDTAGNAGTTRALTRR